MQFGGHQAQQRNHFLTLCQSCAITTGSIPPMLVLPSFHCSDQVAHFSNRLRRHELPEPPKTGNHIRRIQSPMEPPVHVQARPWTRVHRDISRSVHSQSTQDHLQLAIELLHLSGRHALHQLIPQPDQSDLLILGPSPSQDSTCVRELAREPEFQPVVPLAPST